MCLSEKEFGNVFLKQTRRKRQKKRKKEVSEHFLRGPGWSLLHVVIFVLLTLKFLLRMCVHNHNCQLPGFQATPNSEGFIGMSLNEGGRAIYGSEWKEKSRREDRSEYGH